MSDFDTPIRIVVPDIGPLITLLRADALEALFAFGDDVRIVLTDYVVFEVTRDRAAHPDGKRMADFLAKHVGRIEIEKTELGQSFIDTDNLVKKLAGYPELMKALGIDAWPKSHGNNSEMMINHYLRYLGNHPPERQVLVLVDDEFFLTNTPTAPNDVAIVSTENFVKWLSMR